MSWSGNVQIHGVPGTGYPGQPKIYTSVSFGDVWRDGQSLYCSVSASLNAMGSKSYFGYYITVFAQLDDGPLQQLYHKPNSPSRWNSGVYTGSGTISSTNSGSSATLSIWFQSQCGNECWSAPQPYKMFSVSVEAPPLSPPNVSLWNSGYGANYISWGASADAECDNWYYKLDGWQDGYYSTDAWSAPGSLWVTSDIHSLYVQAHRKNGLWGTSNTVTWDCRIPNINWASITVNSINSGTLYFYTDYNVNYYINDVYLGTGSGNIWANLTLSENEGKNYILKITRTENTGISNTQYLWADTTKAELRLSAWPVGTTIKYSVGANTQCRDWYVVLSWYDIYGAWQSQTVYPTTDITDTVTGMFKDLDIRYTYNIQCFATKNSNNVLSSSQTISVQPDACVHITENNISQIAVPYVYDVNRGWLKVSPYVFDNNEWKPCV